MEVDLRRARRAGHHRDGTPASSTRAASASRATAIRPSSYVVIDTEAGTAEFHRVSYDIDRTQRLMRDVDLPARLVERLRYGR